MAINFFENSAANPTPNPATNLDASNSLPNISQVAFSPSILSNVGLIHLSTYLAPKNAASAGKNNLPIPLPMIPPIVAPPSRPAPPPKPLSISPILAIPVPCAIPCLKPLAGS